ncbi:hypothetical protein EO087_09300 [Dyella sp. M7H15-1]|uniref:type III secretion system chaperone n=1 Tax=Dyella sp. M7H15-1 TaxID=2501295 RepID=UPI0010050234|nr:type III secretion system chaperone [Dyella sp. M7H15-1]QAU24162.1 hypothetical protein EO087_09300 [Dyella sp. M7H15-1]
MTLPAPSAQAVLTEFAHHHGIAGFTLSHEGTAALRLPDGMEVFLEVVETAAKLFVYVPLDTLPQGQARQAYLEQLLHLNCLEHGTVGATLAVDSHTETVLLHKSVSRSRN